MVAMVVVLTGCSDTNSAKNPNLLLKYYDKFEERCFPGKKSDLREKAEKVGFEFPYDPEAINQITGRKIANGIEYILTINYHNITTEIHGFTLTTRSADAGTFVADREAFRQVVEHFGQTHVTKRDIQVDFNKFVYQTGDNSTVSNYWVNLMPCIDKLEATDYLYVEWMNDLTYRGVLTAERGYSDGQYYITLHIYRTYKY